MLMNCAIDTPGTAIAASTAVSQITKRKRRMFVSVGSLILPGQERS